MDMATSYIIVFVCATICAVQAMYPQARNIGAGPQMPPWYGPVPMTSGAATVPTQNRVPPVVPYHNRGPPMIPYPNPGPPMIPHPNREPPMMQYPNRGPPMKPMIPGPPFPPRPLMPPRPPLFPYGPPPGRMGSYGMGGRQRRDFRKSPHYLAAKKLSCTYGIDLESMVLRYMYPRGCTPQNDFCPLKYRGAKRCTKAGSVGMCCPSYVTSNEIEMTVRADRMKKMLETSFIFELIS